MTTKDALEHFKYVLESWDNKDICIVTNKGAIKKAVEILEKKCNKVKKSKWISTKERLPQYGEHVLIAINTSMYNSVCGFHWETSYAEGFFDERSNRFGGWYIVTRPDGGIKQIKSEYKVIAWRKLPLYEKGATNDR